jgi:hypothetical protein
MSAEQRLLMFIGTLPPTVNPYRATANKLEEEISVGPFIIPGASLTASLKKLPTYAEYSFQ